MQLQKEATYSVRTTGKVDVGESFEFTTRSKYLVGDTVDLKTVKPITDPAYGYGQVTGYLGPGRDQSTRKYSAVRIR
jgi:hypothetical protein